MYASEKEVASPVRYGTCVIKTLVGSYLTIDIDDTMTDAYMPEEHANRVNLAQSHSG